jgi:hypothetical protein
MPKLSKDAVTPNAEGPATEWRAELDGYTASVVKVDADVDLTELLKGLPGDQCPSPHWGYMVKGSIWCRYDEDRDEVIQEGEAFYVPPGHTAGANAGAEQTRGHNSSFCQPLDVMYRLWLSARTAASSLPRASATAFGSGPWTSTISWRSPAGKSSGRSPTRSAASTFTWIGARSREPDPLLIGPFPGTSGGRVRIARQTGPDF